MYGGIESPDKILTELQKTAHAFRTFRTSKPRVIISLNNPHTTEQLTFCKLHGIQLWNKYTVSYSRCKYFIVRRDPVLYYLNMTIDL